MIPEITAFQELSSTSIVLRLFLSMVIGGILGMERGFKNRPAGFRTYILVCVGAAIIMMTNQYVFQTYATSDPVRMGAQVVSGIGFLGAGTIMVTNRNQIRGITTAAGIWVAGGLGLAIGIGFYEGAIWGAIFILISMTTLHRLDFYIRKNSRVIHMYIEFKPDMQISRLLDQLQELGCSVSDIQLSKSDNNKEPRNAMFYSVNLPKHMRHSVILEKISRMESITYSEEL